MSAAGPQQGGNMDMNKDRDVSINIPKDVPFTLSHVTINGNVQFNVNYKLIFASELPMLSVTVSTVEKNGLFFQADAMKTFVNQ